MNYIIGCDAHKCFSQIAVFEEQSRTLHQMRVDHKPGAICDFLAKYPEVTPVGLESSYSVVGLPPMFNFDDGQNHL